MNHTNRNALTMSRNAVSSSAYDSEGGSNFHRRYHWSKYEKLGEEIALAETCSKKHWPSYTPSFCFQERLKFGYVALSNIAVLVHQVLLVTDMSSERVR